jgi:Arc/MetJ-type ribon-helix-helix transcriptional regulator
MNMKRPVSITIGEDNLIWLKAQAAAGARGSVSEVVDRLVQEARTSGRTDAAAIRSVVGSIDLPEDDEDLSGADAYVRGLFDRSLSRPMMVRERPAKRKAKKPVKPRKATARG